MRTSALMEGSCTHLASSVQPLDPRWFVSSLLQTSNPHATFPPPSAPGSLLYFAVRHVKLAQSDTKLTLCSSRVRLPPTFSTT